MDGVIEVRIIRIKLKSGVTEILATNILEDEMKEEEFKELYNLRWGIETNYHYLKESMKIEAITSSKEKLIEQDILSQMFVFNLLQATQNVLEEEIEQEKYKHKMKININMAVGYIKKRLIIILLEEDDRKRGKLMDELDNKIIKHIVPIRPGRGKIRVKNKRNKYPINKRKTF